MDGSLHPTSAGLLMFGREEALARVFPGLELSNHLETGRREENACDFYFSARRQLQSQHPQEVAWAINEALVNALAHADYQDHPQIEIRANPQEVQVVNRGPAEPPGSAGQPGSLSDVSFDQSGRRPRNRTFADRSDLEAERLVRTRVDR